MYILFELNFKRFFSKSIWSPFCLYFSISHTVNILSPFYIHNSFAKVLLKTLYHGGIRTDDFLCNRVDAMALRHAVIKYQKKLDYQMVLFVIKCNLIDSRMTGH
jgi:nitrogenase subunit NifH